MIQLEDIVNHPDLATPKIIERLALLAIAAYSSDNVGEHFPTCSIHKPGRNICTCGRQGLVDAINELNDAGVMR